MDKHLYNDLVDNIRKVAGSVYGIIDTEKFFIRKSGMKYDVDLHATAKGDLTVKEGHTIAHNPKDPLRHEIPQLGHVIIHIEPDE
jgi:divalent metal cation (Fe/Co/Zn/Cd) transporter